MQPVKSMPAFSCYDALPVPRYSQPDALSVVGQHTRSVTARSFVKAPERLAFQGYSQISLFRNSYRPSKSPPFPTVQHARQGRQNYIVTTLYCGRTLYLTKKRAKVKANHLMINVYLKKSTGGIVINSKTRSNHKNFISSPSSKKRATK